LKLRNKEFKPKDNKLQILKKMNKRGKRRKRRVKRRKRRVKKKKRRRKSHQRLLKLESQIINRIRLIKHPVTQ
jgi:hypothetical protein